MPASKINLHLPSHLIDGVRAGQPGFYSRLLAGLAARGAEVGVERRGADGAIQTEGWEADFNLVHQGRITHPSVLNTGLAYVFPFWYADPTGICGDSSIAKAPFDSLAIPQSESGPFYRRLKKRLIEGRVARYDQPAERRELPEGAVSVFLQGRSDPLSRAQYMPTEDMLKSVLRHRDGRPVIIKPHPNETDVHVYAALQELERQYENVVLTDANVHDILETSYVSCSISSGVALESMVHKVPTILFGRSDLHHCAVTVMRPGQLRQAMRQIAQGGFHFEAFLYWFLQQNCINAGQEDFVEQVIARMGRGGFDTGRLGL
jgi:hypothetical protein